jgi:hypothetical protein
MGSELLGQIVDVLDGEYSDAIFVREEQWGLLLSGASEAIIVPAGLRDAARPSGMRYLLELGIARELIEDYESALCRPLTRSEKVCAIVHYAVQDAPLDPKELACDH